MPSKSLLPLLFLSAVAACANAAEIKLVDTVYTRSGGSTVPEDRMLKVHFVDVGAGDAIVIDTPSDKKLLIDGGYTYRERGPASREYAAYIDRHVVGDDVDLIVISHPDFDHFAGLQNLLDDHEVLDVHQVWASGYDSTELSDAWRALLKTLKKLQRDDGMTFLSPLGRHMDLGDQLTFDDAGTPTHADDTVITLVNTRDCISPTAYGDTNRHLDEGQRRNSSSIVLRLDYGPTSFLFTGDVNGRDKRSSDDAWHDDQERLMVDAHKDPANPLYGLLDVDVLKVAHHGSNGSSSLPFLKAASPTWAVISAGNPYGHPHEDVLLRLGAKGIGLSEQQILRTDHGDKGRGSEANLGDDTYVFSLDPEGIVSIEKWNIKL